MSRGNQLLYLSGVLGLAFLGLPFAALIRSTHWMDIGLLPGDFDALEVSLMYTAIALLIIMIFGTPLAYWLARRSFRGKWIAELLVLLPLLTPPLAMGILLSTLYGPYGWAGKPLADLGLELTNSKYAFVIAQIYSAAPYFIVTARAAFEAVPQELEQVALTLGKTPWQCFFAITLPLARLGLAAGVALAWVRALGEFGVVLIMAYFPQGIPVKLWVNLQDYGLSAVYPLLWFFFLIAMPIPLILGLLSRHQGEARG